MKKSLILTVAAATLLAVSCGKGSGGQKSWDKDAKTFMMQHLGEVLPYVAFNADSFSFEPDVEYYPEDGVVYGEFYASDSNDKNILSNYGKSLEKAGWTLEVPDEPRSLGVSEEYETYSKETKNGALAYVTFGYVVPEEDDDFNAGNVIACEFIYEPQLLESVSFDEAEKLYSDNKIKIDLPELVKAPEADPEVRLAEGEGEGEGEGEEPEATGFVKLISYGRGSVTYDIYGVELADFEAFGAQMKDAGWTVEADYYGDLSCTYGETLARAYLQDYTYLDGSVRFQFYVLDTKISFADVVSVYKEAGIEVKIPDFTGAGFTYDVSGINYMISGAADSEFDSWALALKTAGWNLAQDSYGNYAGRFGKTLASIEIEYISYLDLWYIAFDIEEPAVWPAEAIAADFESLGFTDTLPVYSGEALGYQYSASTHQLAIMVEAGTEATAIETYQSQLTGAQFTEAGADSYGDMHYLSPNQQFDIVVWNGVDADYPGYVIADIKPYVAPSAAFPVATVNQFLTQYGLGFTLTEEDVADISALAENFEVDYGTDSSGRYHFIKVSFDGSHSADVDAVLGSILTTAGYQLNEEETTYIDYYNAAYHEVQIKESNGKTVIYFWE